MKRIRNYSLFIIIWVNLAYFKIINSCYGNGFLLIQLLQDHLKFRLEIVHTSMVCDDCCGSQQSQEVLQGPSLEDTYFCVTWSN